MSGSGQICSCIGYTELILSATTFPANNQELVLLLMIKFSLPNPNAASVNTCRANLIYIFDITFRLAVDVDSKYILNRFPYLGKDEKWYSYHYLTENIVLQLFHPYLDIVNRSRRDIPARVTNAHLPLQNSFILKHNDWTITVYQAKVNKNVLVLCTMHPSVAINGDKKRHPERISY
ncbi:hypothetical protein PR048_023471 [Dryococelus australis]|uniref:Uncharacterized protein n=1 Tax=Dryococelus australis TaxID=614101 RepID=A0ABQ9GU61_9NEOP|nr:hypothetical protein PR048_023471 [Dryococelus australis]